MSQVTVAQLAEVLGISVEKLIAQMSKANINLTSGDDSVSNDDKKKLLAHLRSAHGKSESDATAPRKVTLKRKSISELRIQGSGPRASTKTVNVEFRKSRTYVKREALQEDPEREKVQQALKEEIEKIKTYPPSEREVQKAKNQIEASFIMEQDSIYMQARTIGTFEMLGGWRMIETYLDGIRSVTPEDVRFVAEQYLIDESKISGILIPREKNTEKE